MSAEQTWIDHAVEVDDELEADDVAGRQLPADLLYERALAGLPCWVQDSQGRRTQLPVQRWLGGPAVAITRSFTVAGSRWDMQAVRVAPPWAS